MPEPACDADQDKATGGPGSVNPIEGVEWGTLHNKPPGSPSPGERATSRPLDGLQTQAIGEAFVAALRDSLRRDGLGHPTERLVSAAHHAGVEAAGEVVRAAVAEEREACAKVAELMTTGDKDLSDYDSGFVAGCDYVAAAIRARA